MMHAGVSIINYQCMQLSTESILLFYFPMQIFYYHLNENILMDFICLVNIKSELSLFSLVCSSFFYIYMHTLTLNHIPNMLNMLH